MSTQSSGTSTDSINDVLWYTIFYIVFGAFLGIWLTGQVAGLLFRFNWPDTSLDDMAQILPGLSGNFDDPAQAWPEAVAAQLPGPVGFYIAALLVFSVLTAAGILLIRLLGTVRSPRGFASAAELDRALTHRAALRKAKRLRPDLGRKAEIEDVAVDLGRAVGGFGKRLAASIENSILVLAAPRQGKTSQVIIPWLRAWRGPALVTSIRRDVVLATHELRRDTGPVAVLDVSDTEWPYPLRWSPVAGCEDYDQARRRANVMVTVGRSGGDSTNAGYFHNNAVNLLAGWLHIAALEGRTMDDVVRWAMDPGDNEPIELLRANPGTVPGVAGNLFSLYNGNPDSRGDLFNTVQTAVTPLLSAKAKRLFSCHPADSIDIEQFLRESGTMYLLAPSTQSSQLAPLISAFVDHVTEVATNLADQSPSERLDPPLGLILDEVANVVPLENLPALMSYSAGSGIFVVAILQEIAQARARWGRDGADMLWGASTVKIALAGLAGEEAQWFADLSGTWREHVVNRQHGPNGSSTSPTERERSTITSKEVRTLNADRGEALVIHASTPAVKTLMRRHYESAEAKDYERSATETKQMLGRGAAVAESVDRWRGTAR
ncbi:type IV secretory system conjugative DNA transfer family protein [Glycomyces harbinensis]|uniref:Type IV secretory pathway, VirD4 component, TraG/TraD family ATPase n=1 Tax=Glycomyces harbinensis TaxID=58114 RepID=A0A1G6Y893_9ACTN|nr:type IV secretory system conjugative DNA transfer family protein [Glycomyces harbinensis]SDD86628.1 Type IV secretory pathway, VirD4 component, TraG/TraD family ATPase [Glycomyces harbinensis]